MGNLSITAANVQNSDTASIVDGIAAVAITAGQVLYKLLNGTYGLADANGTTPAFKVAGIALNDAGPGQPVQLVTNDVAFVSGGTMTKGTIYILSGTPGAIAPVADLTTGWNRQILGVALSSTVLYLKIINSNVTD